MRDASRPTIEPREDECASCGVDLGDEQGKPVCGECDRRLEAQLDLWLGYSAAARAIAQAATS